MSIDEIRVVLDLVAIMVAIAAMIYAHVRTKDTARQQQIQSLQNRLTKAESRLEETPTTKALHELELSIVSLSGELKETVARLDGLNNLMDRVEATTVRMEDFLRNSNKGAG